MAIQQTKTSERKYYTVEDLENSGNTGAVWVLNSTDYGGQEGGNLIFSVPKLNGQGIDPVRVPKTFIPIDLTAQVPRGQLLASSEFRNAIRVRNIRLLNPAYAKHLLSHEDAKEEQRRIENAMLRNKAAIEAQMVAGEEEDEFFDPNEKSDGNTKSKMRQEIQETVVKKAAASASTKVQQIASDAVNENWTQTRVIAALKNTKLAKPDLNYLAKKFKDSPKVIKHLKEVLKTLKAAE